MAEQKTSRRKTGRRKARVADDSAGQKPPVWGGVIGGRLKPLNDDEVELIEETALHLLETLGLSQAIPSMIEKVTAAGGSVTEDDRLLFPRELVRETIAGARRDITLFGQKTKHDICLSGARVHMSSGGAAPGVFDIDTKEYRESTTKDLYAAALGAQAAAPDRPVVAVMGDGGFGFTMAEITSAVQHQLPVIAVVIDNGAWGAEKAYQKEFFDGRLLGAEIIGPDYAEVAKLCGALGYSVEQPGDTAAALKDALEQRKPAVIHVKVDPEAINALRKDLFKK